MDLKTRGPEENQEPLTAANLIRWSGLAALAAGLIFVAIQPIHPEDVLASVTTPVWALIMPVKLAMSLLFLVGITGIYARQVKDAGRVGLAGYLLFSLSWTLQMAFIFIETFSLPSLATIAPQYVESFLGIVNGAPGAVDVGAVAAAYNVAGITYVLGGLLLGIATVRARVLPRWPALLFAVAAASTPLAAVLPHPLNRSLAVPMGLSLAWLGYALWAERRGQQQPATPAWSVTGSAAPKA
ncbi:MAG: hypothetical protein KDE59_20950 [Anaerolineales bacterium]|nr:hypothetical protein [Anaerolineales bacterium]MCB0029055.1 hypothetical protein [Anaerolineales bacterium]